MTTYFVTRHKGAVDWAREQGIEAQHIPHLAVERLKPGDTVLGTLPISIVAELCAKDCRYFHLSLDIPPQKRGQELTLADMKAFGAVLEEYEARRLS